MWSETERAYLIEQAEQVKLAADALIEQHFKQDSIVSHSGAAEGDRGRGAAYRGRDPMSDRIQIRNQRLVPNGRLTHTNPVVLDVTRPPAKVRVGAQLLHPSDSV